MKKIFFAVLFLLLAVGATYYAYKVQKNNKVVCTQEALLCPDGSYVVRQGSKCEFNSCPNSSPFSGKLIQVSDGFQLIIESPDKNSQEVAYALPLKTDDSDVPTALINKKVKIFGTFDNGITFKVHKIEADGDITLDSVKVGESVFINGVRITLNNIVQDSRCPVDVQCIWAGSVIANVSLKSNTDFETTNIESDKTPLSFDSFLISIEKIIPSKTTISPTPDMQHYILTFKVAPR